jgi:hypothetical protein
MIVTRAREARLLFQANEVDVLGTASLVLDDKG